MFHNETTVPDQKMLKYALCFGQKKDDLKRSCDFFIVENSSLFENDDIKEEKDGYKKKLKEHTVKKVNSGCKNMCMIF